MLIVCAVCTSMKSFCVVVSDGEKNSLPCILVTDQQEWKSTCKAIPRRTQIFVSWTVLGWSDHLIKCCHTLCSYTKFCTCYRILFILLKCIIILLQSLLYIIILLQSLLYYFRAYYILLYYFRAYYITSELIILLQSLLFTRLR